MSDKKKIAWVTGASSGIGKALCIKLINNDWTVIGSSRNINNLKNLKLELGENFYFMTVDIKNRNSINSAVKKIFSEIGNIDLAILNAGIYQPETDGLNIDISEDTISTNVIGTMNCLSAILPEFIQRGNGHLVLMSSIAGYRGLPKAYSYTSSRAAIINLAESLKIDLTSKGIKIQLITPGFVDTELTQKNDFYMPFLINSETAASMIIKGLSKNNFEITFPRKLSYIMKILRILPYPLYFLIVRQFTKK